MKKPELERMLMDPEGLKKLTERANNIKEKEGITGRTDSNPAFRFQAVEPLFHEIRPSPEEIKANSEDYVAAKPLLIDIGRFVPELEKEDPRKVLSILTERCKKDPSECNQLLVENAINRLTFGGALDKDTERLVTEAVEMLTTPKKTGKQGEKKIDSIWSRVYRHANYGGNSAFLHHGPGWVYRLFYSGFLQTVHLHDRISSLYIDASAGEVAGLVILFQHNRFVGRYAMFPTTPGASTQTNWVSYVGNFINDRTSSILVVRRFDNEITVPFVSSYPGDLKDEIRDFVSSVPRISPRGNPTITWDMWPNFDQRRFIYIRIPIRVDVPNWFDYDAEVHYWIYPYVDSAGSLRAYIAWYGAWVEGGVKSGSILDQLMDNIPSSFGTVNSKLNQALAIANIFKPLKRQYFLPGSARNQGYTDDDITLVLVRK
jgi:hypothetical protein